MNTDCDIFIRSYYKDFAWLRYALCSIRRYCHGFSNVVLVTPKSSRQKLDWARLAGDVTVTCPDYKDDYLGQQVTKLTADELSEAEFICHVDSDCVFRRPTTPADLFEATRPVVLMTAYRELDPHVPWQGITERLLQRQVLYEFMRTPPYTFPRWIYRAFREHVFALHGKSLEDYVLAQPHRGFSEFNALGAYAFLNHSDHFTWRDVGNDGSCEGPCRVFWSWAGIDETTKQEIETLLR